VREHHRGRDVAWVGDRRVLEPAGECPSAGAAQRGLDQLTLEARAYGRSPARSTVQGPACVGFIGPEYLATSDGHERGLEDHFMASARLPMGATSATQPTRRQNSADNMLIGGAGGCQLRDRRPLRGGRDAQRTKS